LKKYVQFVINLLLILLAIRENIVPNRAITKVQQEENGHRTEEQNCVNGVKKNLLAPLLILKQKAIIFVLILALLCGGLSTGFTVKIIQVGWVVIVQRPIKITGHESKRKSETGLVVNVKFAVASIS
jgi:hypothetical protein